MAGPEPSGALRPCAAPSGAQPASVRLPKKPSMKRRALWNDYRAPNFYMITINKAPSAPPFGRLRGSLFPAPVKNDHPCIELSEPGHCINRRIEALKESNPKISVICRIIMPDHLHILLHVRKRLEEHLGKLINSLKYSSTSLAISSGLIKEGESLFEKGYNDRIVRHPGQIETLKNYILDNPRRLLLKTLYPDLFCRAWKIATPRGEMDAFGNIFLLKEVNLIQVQVSRKISDEELKKYLERIGREVNEGAVLVSPFISPGEKAAKELALEMGGRIIQLLSNGFSERYKPVGKSFDLCVGGRLLQLAPPVYFTENIPLSRGQALGLNDFAAEIAKGNFRVLRLRRH